MAGTAAGAGTDIGGAGTAAGDGTDTGGTAAGVTAAGVTAAGATAAGATAAGAGRTVPSIFLFFMNLGVTIESNDQFTETANEYHSTRKPNIKSIFRSAFGAARAGGTRISIACVAVSVAVSDRDPKYFLQISGASIRHY